MPAHKPSSDTVLEARVICRAHTLHMLGRKEAVERLRRSESLPSANQDEIHSNYLNPKPRIHRLGQKNYLMAIDFKPNWG